MLDRLAKWRMLGALSVVVALVASVLTLAGSEADSLADSAGPAFFAWGDEPYDDGLRHFLVRLDPTISIDTAGPFSLTDDGEIVVEESALPDWIAGDLLLTLEGISDLGGSGENEVPTVEFLTRLDGVHRVEALGYETYALATEYTASEIAALPGVRRVDEDTPLATASVDEFAPYQWPIENLGITADGSPATAGADIKASEAWHRTRGSGVVVAVIDSGVDVDHPDLARNIWTNPDEVCGNAVDDDGNGFVDDCRGWNFIDGNADVADHNGHGTHIAGIIAAEFNNLIGVAGIAPEAVLMPLKIGGETPSLSRALLAFDYAIQNGARIINASWVSSDPAAEEYLSPYLDAAEAAGILVVVGAGNDGVNIDEAPVWPASSGHSNVLTVAASNAMDLPAEFSNYGRESVDIFAPGDRIISTLPGGSYGVYSGTSMAAPQVAGAAALLWSATPESTYAEVKGALMDRSDGPNDGLIAFRNLAASDGRLNSARAIFTRLFQSEVVYWFHDFNSLLDSTRHEVTVQVLLNDPDNVPPTTPLRYRATLVAPVEGAIRGVVGHEISVPGLGTVTTDLHGRAYVGETFERQRTHALLDDGHMVPLEMSLPRGSYALAMEMLDVSNPEAPRLLGQASAVFFEVGLGSAGAMPIRELPPPTSIPVTMPPIEVPEMSIPTVPIVDTSTPTTTSVVPTTVVPNSTTTLPGISSATTTTTVDLAEVLDDPVSTSTTLGSSPSTTPIAPTSSTSSTIPTLVPGGPQEPTRFQIGAINPTRGPVEGGTEVVVVGESLPANPLVMFGDKPARIDANDAPESYIVITPPGPPGTVDVIVVDLDAGSRVVMADAFTYIADDGGGVEPLVTTTTHPVEFVTPETLPVVSSTSTVPPAFVPTTSPPSQPETTLPESTTTTSLMTEGNIVGWMDQQLVTPEGLDFGDLAPDSPLQSWDTRDWAGGICTESPCRGWDL
ncbi:MAG: S8 family peptidase [Acidimicrobiia bacterium]